MDNSNFYEEKLYPLQNSVLKVIGQVETKFYLTGGTAASRGYLNHRYSDDLDFFVNDDEYFELWVSRITQALNSTWKCTVLMNEKRFARLHIVEDEVLLKIEMINDVPARVGEIIDHPILGKLDSAENIFANKISALIGRNEPKDLVDIWAFSSLKKLSLQDAITNAQSKAAGIFPADLARILCSVKKNDWEIIRWINKPPVEKFISQLNDLGEGLILP